jgi:hypothetical protein
MAGDARPEPLVTVKQTGGANEIATAAVVLKRGVGDRAQFHLRSRGILFAVKPGDQLTEADGMTWAVEKVTPAAFGCRLVIGASLLCPPTTTDPTPPATEQTAPTISTPSTAPSSSPSPAEAPSRKRRRQRA